MIARYIMKHKYSILLRNAEQGNGCIIHARTLHKSKRYITAEYRLKLNDSRKNVRHRSTGLFIETENRVVVKSNVNTACDSKHASFRHCLDKTQLFLA